MSSKVIELSALPDAQKLPEDKARRIVMMTGVAAVVGIVLCVLGALSDSERFAYSYLVGFAYAYTIAMGGFFFVILQHAVKAGWSIAPRRQMEWLMGAVPALIVLFIPVAVMAPKIYKNWWLGSHALEDEHLAHMEGWLNPTFWYVRAAIYLVIWTVVALYYTRTSRAQDTSGDPKLTVRMQVAASPLLIVFALSLSFAGFDWLMSLEPHWYSTIFGVYTFAGSFLSSLALLAVMTVWLQKGGYFKRVSTVEHRHDIGKLMFAFTVFWGYIAFSQFMLQWYANLPEETFWFAMRWDGPWRNVSLTLIFVQFAIPFLFMLPKTIKRIYGTLMLGGAILLVAHYVDMYWLIMPTLGERGATPSWIDIGGFLGPVGVLAFVVARNAARGPLYPLKDPRLIEGVTLENVV